MGYNTFRFKIVAFAVSGFFAPLSSGVPFVRYVPYGILGTVRTRLGGTVARERF